MAKGKGREIFTNNLVITKAGIPPLTVLSERAWVGANRKVLALLKSEDIPPVVWQLGKVTVDNAKYLGNGDLALAAGIMAGNLSVGFELNGITDNVRVRIRRN